MPDYCKDCIHWQGTPGVDEEAECRVEAPRLLRDIKGHLRYGIVSGDEIACGQFSDVVEGQGEQ